MAIPIRSSNMNKLVRDKIPMIIQESGKNCSWRIAAQEERLQYTNNKIQEEAHELSHVTTKEEAVEEICDLIEIIAVAAQERQITKEEIEAARKAKNEKRGAFERFIILEKVN